MSQNQIPVTDVSSQGHGGCGCGCSSVQDELPRLDARPFPPNLRHAAILGAVASLAPGEGMELFAPHVPRPLLMQIDSQIPGDFSYELVYEGDDGAIVAIRRTA